MAIRPCDVPAGALLLAYARSGYVDCYVTEVPASLSHAEYVEAFYSTALFGIERRLLAWIVSRPSTDRDVRALATGDATTFAAWTVEARKPDQLLLADFRGRTRSWLMSAPITDSLPGTRLYFGSAVVRSTDARSGRTGMGFAFRALLGFHKLYSRLLLRAAVARLVQSKAGASGH